MNTATRLAELEVELSALKMDLAQLVAQIRGHETQIAALRAGAENRGELSTLPCTEAILSILRQAGGTLGPTDILRGLQAAGRKEDLRKVTATLDYLVKRQRATKSERGRYLAA